MIILLWAAALAAAEPVESPPEDPVKTLAAAQGLYDQSCGVKGYASYDDLCGPLRDSIRDAQKSVDKAAKARRDAARAAKTKPVDTAAGQPPAATNTAR